MLESWRVGQLMERDWALTTSPDTPLGELVKGVKFGTRPVFAVVRGDELVGLVSVADIHRAVEDLPFADAVIAMDLMTERTAVAFPDEDIYQVFNEFSRDRHDVLPVVSRDDPKRWLGMLTRERVFRAVRQQIEETQMLALREHKALAAMEQEGQLHELVVGMAPAQMSVVQRLLVPLQVVGKSLREADFRRTYGVQVIAVERPDGSLQCPPDIDAPLQTNQRLVALVESPDLPGGPSPPNPSGC